MKRGSGPSDAARERKLPAINRLSLAEGERQGRERPKQRRYPAAQRWPGEAL
jgi:hypothetical protein